MNDSVTFSTTDQMKEFNEFRWRRQHLSGIVEVFVEPIKNSFVTPE
jgi:hypothetical protein